MEARRDRIGRDRDEEAFRGNATVAIFALLVTPAMASNKGDRGGGRSTRTRASSSSHTASSSSGGRSASRRTLWDWLAGSVPPWRSDAAGQQPRLHGARPPDTEGADSSHWLTNGGPAECRVDCWPTSPAVSPRDRLTALPGERTSAPERPGSEAARPAQERRLAGDSRSSRLHQARG